MNRLLIGAAMLACAAIPAAAEPAVCKDVATIGQAFDAQSTKFQAAPMAAKVDEAAKVVALMDQLLVAFDKAAGQCGADMDARIAKGKPEFISMRATIVGLLPLLALGVAAHELSAKDKPGEPKP
jgi:hypothetical protein